MTDLINEMTEAAKDLEKAEFECLARETGLEDKQWKDKSDDEKIACCTHQTGRARKGKMPNGEVMVLPIYCHLCNLCLADQANYQRRRFDEATKKAQDACPDGQWLKVEKANGTEANSFKKAIARNHGKRHITYESDAPGIDMILYWTDDPEAEGHPASKDEINFDAINRRNKISGRKISYGGGVRANPPMRQEDTERILIPTITVEKENSAKSERIIFETNLLREVSTLEEFEVAYGEQFKMIVAEHERAGIEILSIHDDYYNMLPEEILEGWNRHVHFWLSVSAAMSESLAENTDKETLLM